MRAFGLAPTDIAAPLFERVPFFATRRSLQGGVLFVAVEVLLMWRYGVHGAMFHYWLHAACGVALAFTVLAIARHAMIDSGWGAAETALVGHLYASFPDLIHAGGRIPHRPWMDIFAWHIQVHDWPAPLLTTGSLAALATVGLACVSVGRHRVAHGALVAGVALGGSAHLTTALSGTANGA